MRLLIVSVSALVVGLVLSGCTQQCCGPDGACYEYQGGGSCPEGYYGGGAGPSGSYGSYGSSSQGAQDACCYPDGTCCAADGDGSCPANPPAGGTTGGVTVVPIHGHGTSTSATSSSGGGDSAGQTSGGTSSGTAGDSTGTAGGSTGTTGGVTGTTGGGTGTTGGATGTTGGSTGGGLGTSGSGGNACDAGPPVLIGAPCSCDSECAANEVCVPSLNYSSNPDAPTQWVNGYCTFYNCDLANPCPADAVCYRFPQGSASLYSLCLASCTSSACNRSGYTCGEIGDPVAACLPECVHDCDCSSGLVCESGSCQQPCYVDTQCGPNEVCNGNHCQAGPPLACCDLPGMAPCPDGMDCQSGTCVIGCTYDVECPAGERCQSDGNCG